MVEVEQITCSCGVKMTPHAKFEHVKTKKHFENLEKIEKFKKLTDENELLKKLVASLLIKDEEKIIEKAPIPREVLITREKIKDELFEKIFPNCVQLVQSRLDEIVFKKKDK